MGKRGLFSRIFKMKKDETLTLRLGFGISPIPFTELTPVIRKKGEISKAKRWRTKLKRMFVK